MCIIEGKIQKDSVAVLCCLFWLFHIVWIGMYFGKKVADNEGSFYWILLLKKKDK